MPSSIFPQQYDFICLHCPLSEYQCPDYRNTKRNRANCSLLKVVKNPPTDKQMRELREVIRLRGYRKDYQEKHLARMMVLQAERNALPVGSITLSPGENINIPGSG